MDIRSVVIRRMTELGLTRDDLILMSGASRSAVYAFLPAKLSTKPATIKVEHLEKMLSYIRLTLVEAENTEPDNERNRMSNVIRSHLAVWSKSIDASLFETKSGRRWVRTHGCTPWFNTKADGSGRTVDSASRFATTGLHRVGGSDVYANALAECGGRNLGKREREVFARTFWAEVERTMRMARLDRRLARKAAIDEAAAIKAAADRDARVGAATSRPRTRPVDFRLDASDI